MLAAFIALGGTSLAVLHARAQPGDGGSALPARPVSPASSAPPARTPGSPDDAGQGLGWADFHGIQLPVSAHDGPHDTRGGMAQGFTDTPRGALLAAINIAVRTAALWGPAIYTPTITHQVTGPDAAVLLKADAEDYAQMQATAHVRAGQPAGRGYAVEAAYRFAAWTPAGATADIVTEGPGTSGTAVLAVTRIEVLWQHGDWRVVAPPGGDWSNAAAPVSSLTGYTAFPARSEPACHATP
jgi:hypothetical protein